MGIAASMAEKRQFFSQRKIVHMSMVAFAFLLPFLTRLEAAGCAALALLFNLFVLPNLDVDLSKRDSAEATRRIGQEGEAPPRSYIRASENVWTGIVVYPLSVLVLVLLYGGTMHVVAAVWAIMALGDGMAGVVGGAMRGPALPFNSGKRWSGFCAFLLAGTAGAFVLTRWTSPSVPAVMAFAISAATALVGALVESLPIGLDDNVSVPLVCGGFMYCLYWMERSALASNMPYLGRRILVALVVNLLFALLACGLKQITSAGAATGFVLGVAVYLGYGYKSFLILLAFVVMGSVATRLGYAKKVARGIAERRGGRRSWPEVLANGLAGAFFSILVITTHREAAFLVAFVAAFAEAAGDTIASEIGQWLGGRAYLITTLRPVLVGENGGISLVGTVAGFAASTVVIGLGFGLGLFSAHGPIAAVIALGAAFAGNLFDSLLGATLERRGLVTNGTVNFAGTSFAGGLALALSLHL